MNVLMLGMYDLQGYSRARIIYKGLQSEGVEVDVYLSKKKRVLARRLLRADFDAVIVTGKPTLLISWFLSWWHRTPVFFDVFISDYETLVLDRKKVKPRSLKAGLLWAGDWLGCKIPSYVVVDTPQNGEFFVNVFGCSSKKIIHIPVGADDTIFIPQEKKHDGFVVYFQGTYIPVQGIEYIIRAAKELEQYADISFELVGKGQTLPEMKKLATDLKLKNVIFHEVLFHEELFKLEELAQFMAKADISVGIFGNMSKGLRAIPNKAYESIAMKKALITEDGSAARAFFTHKKNVFLVKGGSAHDVAEGILALYKNDELRKNIAQSGYELFKERASVEVIGKLVKEQVVSRIMPRK